MRKGENMTYIIRIYINILVIKNIIFPWKKGTRCNFSVICGLKFCKKNKGVGGGTKETENNKKNL